LKSDLKKELTGYAGKVGRFDVVELPTRNYLMIDGAGDPNTAPEYTDALKSLYPTAYSLKFFSKNKLGHDYVVMPLEGLWWAENMDSFTTGRDKSQWSWTMMIGVPDWLGSEHVDAAVEAVSAKGVAPLLDRIRYESLAEGMVVQTLHIGSYDDEGPVLEAMHQQFIPENGLKVTGKHHEIYLSDPRKSAPHRLKTILRQPVAPAHL
jgi:hypothetical protein